MLHASRALRPLSHLSLSVQVFHDIAYKAKDRQDLLAGIDEFLDEVIVLPPGEWDPAIRIEPPKTLPSSDKRLDTHASADTSCETHACNSGITVLCGIRSMESDAVGGSAAEARCSILH